MSHLLNPLLLNKKLDLVDFGECALFMFTHDNLYALSVPAERKHRSLDEFRRGVERNGYPPSPVSPATVDVVDECRHALALVLVHCWREGLEVAVLDIGAFVGDFSVKMGIVSRSFGKPVRVFAFDPTEAGTLIPHNIRINGLEGIVEHVPLAITETDGPVVFTVRSGMSDASFVGAPGGGSASVWRVLRYFFATRRKGALLGRIVRQLWPRRSYSLPAEGVRLGRWLRERNVRGTLLVKIDVEGLSLAVLRQVLELPESPWKLVVVEFTPHALGGARPAAEELRRWMMDHHVFDLWYSPTPARCDLLAAEHVDRFTREIESVRVFGYTDLLLVPKSLPGAGRLVERLRGLKPGPEEYVL